MIRERNPKKIDKLLWTMFAICMMLVLVVGIMLAIVYLLDDSGSSNNNAQSKLPAKLFPDNGERTNSPPQIISNGVDSRNADFSEDSPFPPSASATSTTSADYGTYLSDDWDCVSGSEQTRNCVASNGCQGDKVRECRKGEWQDWSSCETDLIKCSDGSCDESCSQDRTGSSQQTIQSQQVLTDESIIFYYADEPHSNNMKPVVIEYDSVYWLEIGQDAELEQELDLQGKVPAFICYGSKEMIEGEITKQQLSEMIEECES